MPQNNRPLLIGVTGNIGSGKSSFCRFLADYGARVLSADLMAKRHLSDPMVFDKLIERFGKDIVSTENDLEINRHILAQLVFNDPEKLQFLDSLIHPLVLEDMQRMVETAHESFLVFEVPLLFEAGLQNCFDYLILVACPSQIRIKRLQQRGDKEARQRAENQLSDESKRNLVDLVLDNSLDIAQLNEQALRLAKIIPTLGFRTVKPFYPS